MEEFYYLFFFKGHILVYSYKNKQCLGGIWELVFKFYYSNVELEWMNFIFFLTLVNRCVRGHHETGGIDFSENQRELM